MQCVYRSADKHLHVHIITKLGYYIQRYYQMFIKCNNMWTICNKCMSRFILVFATQYAQTDSEGSTTQLHCDNAVVELKGNEQQM